MDATTLALMAGIAATFVFAGFVKGVIGLGLPTVAIALLGLMMAPVQAMALLVVPSLVTNIWQLANGPALKRLSLRLWPMLLGVCAGTAAGAAWGVQSEHAAVALGAALIVYALFGLSAWRPRLHARAEERLAPVVGAVTGLVTVATGVFVIPAVPFLQALDLDKDELVQALGVSFTVSTIAMALALANDGALELREAGLSLVALGPALLGMAIGQRLRVRIPALVFRRCFFVGLLLLGLHLAFKPFF